MFYRELYLYFIVKFGGQQGKKECLMKCAFVLSILMSCTFNMKGMELEEEHLLDDQVEIIEMCFKEEEFCLLAWQIPTEDSFLKLDRKVQKDILKKFPSFQLFLQKNDCLGEQLEVDMQDIEICSKKLMVYLKKPISRKILGNFSNEFSFSAIIKGYKHSPRRKLAEAEINLILIKHNQQKLCDCVLV